MSQIPRDLIRQVQICTRSAPGLSDYNPSDPSLPALQPLSAAIAAPTTSPPQCRCKNCKGTLLRGPESIICIYCGLGPHHDAVPDPISFTSTIGYRWLLGSLHLDGSEMVDPTNKSEEIQGYNTPKTLAPLSDFLHFKIPWPAETEKQETTFPEKQSEQSEASSRLTGVAPDKFFLKSKKNVLSEISNEQPLYHNQIGPDDGKDVASVGHQDLFQNAQLPHPAESPSKHKSSEAFSEWEADFQHADSENQHEFPGASIDSKNNLEDPKSVDHSMDLGVNLGAHMDSMFGSGKNLNDGKPEENPAAVPAFDDWNSDDVWNNLSSSAPHFSSGFDTAVSTKDDPEVHQTPLGYSKDGTEVDNISLAYSKDSSADLFQDFQSETNYTENTENKVTNKENTTTGDDFFGEWNDSKDSSADLFQDFQSETNYTENTENKVTNKENTTTGDDFFGEWNDSKDSSADLFQDFQSETNYTENTGNKVTNEENTTTDEDFFGEWNDFTGSSGLQFPSQNVWTGGDDYQVSTSDQKSSEMDLFSFDNKPENGDFDSFSQPNIFSTSTINNNVTTEVNPVVSENPASDWLFEGSGPSNEFGQAANDRDTSEKSAEDNVKMLISQMHDLSFMLETELCIPSGPDASKSA